MKVTLYQRGQVWWLKKRLFGETIRRSTRTTNKCEARIVARSMIEAIVKGEEERRKAPPKRVTVRQVFTEWELQASGLAASTRKLTRHALSIYTQSIGVDADAPAGDVFTREMLLEFQRREVGGLAGAQKQSRTRTVNSVSRTLRSMFSTKYRYQDLPEAVEGFRAAPLLKEARKTYDARKRKEPIRRAIAGLPGLKDRDLNAYLMGWLCLHAGLRKNEAACARWDWVSDDGITVEPTEEFAPKSGHSRFIPLCPADIAHLRSFRGEGDTILTGDRSARYRRAGDVLSAFLRECGFDGIKSIHELRYHYGATVATKLGIYQAQRYLGHSEPGVTARYYADLTETKPVKIE